MRFSFLLTLAASAVAAPTQEGRVDSLLLVKIEMLGNSEVKAIIRNEGHENLKLLKVGSILSPVPVKKAKVFAQGVFLPSNAESKPVTYSPADKPVQFEGIHIRVALEALEESDFQHIPAGRSAEVAFDLADAYDLSSGGEFGVHIHGAFSFAEVNSTRLVGSVPYSSNYLVARVDGSRAARSYASFLEQRAIVQSDCSGEKYVITRKALAQCASMARRAREAASYGPARRMEEYFKSSSHAVRAAVSDVFDRVASECGSATEGIAKYHCTDIRNGCEGRTLAYTTSVSGNMVFCPLYFKELPDLAEGCHNQDRGSTNIHEATHLDRIKGTEDYGGYGYGFVRSLTREQNLNHADTYALFASAVRQDC